MADSYVEKYQQDKTIFLDAVKQQLKDKALEHLETIKQEVGSTFIKTETKETV